MLFTKLYNTHSLVNPWPEFLSETQWRSLQKTAIALSPEAGTLSLQPGLYLVVRGKVRIANSQQKEMIALKTEEFFGEFTLFPRSGFLPYSVRVSAKAELLLIPESALRPILKKHPALKKTLLQRAREIEQVLGTKTEETDKKSDRAYFPSPAQRLGHWIGQSLRRYPFFEQQSASDCGAASLVMIARYWGKRISVNRLRELANVNRDGATRSGLITAAENIGLSTRPVKATLEGLVKQTLPVIAHWEGKHFVVIWKITAKQVIIGDPAIGQLTLSRAEFASKWTGFTLLLQPNQKFRDTKEDKASLWQFYRLLEPHWFVLLEIFVASLFIQIFGLITPIFTQLILDRVIVQGSLTTLWAMGIGALIFGVFRVAITGLRAYLLDHTANRIDTALITGFIRHTLSLPLGYFESRYVGDIISRVGENRKIQRFLSGEALSILLDLLTVFVYLAVMFRYSWQLALISLAIVPPFLLLALISTPFLQRISRDIFQAIAKESSYLIEILTGIRTVKSTATERSTRWHWEDLFSVEVKKNFSGQIIGNNLQIFSNLIESLATTGLLCFGAYLVIQNQLSIGQLIAFNMLFAQIIAPFQRLTVLWTQFQEVNIAVERINDVLDAEAEENLEKISRQFLPELQGHIRFENVTFRYHTDSDHNVLENLSFEILPGQTVAIVGRSGSGKTTISKLLIGLYPPTDGKVLIDGYDLSTIALSSLRQQVGVVDQDTFLFGSTIRENISLGHPDRPLESVIEAAKLAGIHDFIQSLPMGYETQIGEGGGLLSGGQRQRIAIARSLMGEPRLLILDEATSHLDTESEQIIQNNLQKIRQNRTMVIIAHRLSTVRNADCILVLDRGILVDQGTHKELMSRPGIYRNLNSNQLSE
ncbi:MAG: ATP-binding cassette domain-containing protein [Microcystis panniformis Mp_MB_F_20051200_S9]|uniref:ATP-binding cassette domain-containing protein n=1 Tax=Microcystis panniformis Mp_MB_F_20051200_S9 TaxID=2486223 RepID=A0A552Q839_9CHRO|nr:MAG: ATP-binding cassette domain-containing protein [Microcystis panniformis Mp_GB_SS_20050300_S99D]TRV45028.1 MAG: ATP-binding cassette domain-containing protein [Microcystis panniformis Mp_MB_F_20080800_S26D]TRV46893.1 MAG: ATP-binding cassette domain-containing protein [Microcystis panniformis Mp_GB_SS_20050300_S99]TRV55978.1 MAG: ATP-binding cassette domain-containing protein [Microcystis panniformis Mp_MB_F_20051200_S9D]TRV57219.1 MAG: ATP-binding cassette domain-containing protein [Mic